MNFLDKLKENESNDTVFIHRLNDMGSLEPWTYGFRPSAISYSFCPRLYALGGLGYLDAWRKSDAIGLRRMDNGTDMHARYHKYVQEKDAAYKDERYGDPEDEYRCTERLLTHPTGMRGRYDAILEKPGDPFLYVTDFKSIKQSGDRFSPGFNELNAPLSYHVRQLILYMGMVDELYDLDRPICGLYIYEGKSTQEVKEFKVPWDDVNKDVYKDLIGILEEVNEAVATNDVSKLECRCTKADKCINWDLDKLKQRPKRYYF